MYIGYAAASALFGLVFATLLAITFFLHWEGALKAGICAFVGAILGGLISNPLFQTSRMSGCISLALSFGVAWVLFYTPILPTTWNALVGHIPQSLKRVLRIIIVVIGSILVICLIMLIVMILLHAIGV